MLAKPKILLADDNRDLRELVLVFLKRVGFDVIEASTGSEALSVAHAGHPDLILIDLILPELCGDEVTARLKADPMTRDIAIIIASALPPSHHSVKRAIAHGAVDILAKPFTFKTLGETIRRYISPPQSLEY